MKCVVWHLCPAEAQHGHEALKAPRRLRQPVSTRTAQEGLELHARIGAEEHSRGDSCPASSSRHPPICGPSCCHTVCSQYSAKMPECNVSQMSTVTVCGKVTARIWEKRFQCLAIVCSDCSQKVARTRNFVTRQSKLPTLGNSRLASSLSSVLGFSSGMSSSRHPCQPLALLSQASNGRMRAWAAEPTRTTISHVAQAVL